MLVVVAARQDSVAAAVAAHWAAGGSAILTCRDLSSAGWRYVPGSATSSQAVIGGQVVPARDIRGVLVRLPYVTEQELSHIDPGDRGYVAQEMRAFLLSWLTELPCPVVNQPSATSLAGPGWRPEQWTLQAARLGLRVRPLRWHVRRASAVGNPNSAVEALAAATRPTTLVTVTVVGRRALGKVNARLTDGAMRLAAAAGADLLAVHFDGPGARARFLGADLWPDVSRPEIADAVAERLRGIAQA